MEGEVGRFEECKFFTPRDRQALAVLLWSLIWSLKSWRLTFWALYTLYLLRWTRRRGLERAMEKVGMLAIGQNERVLLESKRDFLASLDSHARR